MTAAELTIREAGLEDLGAVLTVQHEAFRRVASELGIDPSVMPPLTEDEHQLVALFGRGVRFFVAFDGSTVVGSVRVARSEGVVEFGRLVVASTHLRRGVATALMRFAESEHCDAERFTLFTGEDAHAARALYAGLGYSTVRLEDSGPVKLVWLEKRTR